MYQPVERSAKIRTRFEGTCDTIPEKIISDRPCCWIPYSEMIFPSQIAIIVPAIIVNTFASVGTRFEPLQPKSFSTVIPGTI